MKYPSYPRTKPSGVEWFGNVPEHWAVVPFKHRCLRFAVYGANMSSDEYVSDGVRFLRTTDIDDFGQLQPVGVFIEPEQAREYLLNDQDILLSRSGTLGRAFIYSAERHPACAYAGYLVRFVPSPNLNTRFFFHFTKSVPFADWLQTQLISSTIGNVNGQKYAQCPLPLPDRPEQDAIAAFLDRETGRVDRLVAKKRELIERLKEKRTALISRTVTRGLPPAAARAAGLPENPSLKPSGLDWLGDIPKHWEVKKFGYISTVVRGASPRPAGDPRYFDGEFIPWITVGEVTKDDSVYLTATETMLTEDGAANSRTIRKGTLVLTNSGATLGVPKILSITGCANDGIVAFEGLNKDANKLFLYYYLRSLTENLRDRIKQGSGQPNLNTDIVKALGVPFPPHAEQTAIAEYLDAETAKLDALISKVEAAVERLQEYRTALITAAVTGKIDVRDEVSA